MHIHLHVYTFMLLFRFMYCYVNWNFWLYGKYMVILRKLSNWFPEWLGHFILMPAGRVLVASYPYQHMVLSLFLLFVVLMDVECVSWWWMDFDGSWACLLVMNRFLLWLSMPHCDRWTLTDGESCDRWVLIDVGCVSLWLMDFDRG